SRQTYRKRSLRLVVEPQLHRPAGEPGRPHAADEPGDGRRGGAQRQSGRRAGVSGVNIMSNDSKIIRVAGSAIVVRGNDIDTDRIIPARYLKEPTFARMGDYPFFDERFDAAGK